MSFDVWRYEARRLGWPAAAGPPLALAAIAFFSAIAGVFGPTSQVNRILSAGLDVLPVVAGLAAAGIVSSDPALELQMCLPTSYRLTVVRRLTLMLGLTTFLAFLSTVWLSVSGRLVWPVSLISDQLIWIAPLVWMTAAGAMIALGIRSAAVGAGFIAVLWVLEQMFSEFFTKNPDIQPIWLFLRYASGQSITWYSNRIFLIVTALALCGAVFWLLGQSERLLAGDS